MQRLQCLVTPTRQASLLIEFAPTSTSSEISQDAIVEMFTGAQNIDVRIRHGALNQMADIVGKIFSKPLW